MMEDGKVIDGTIELIPSDTIIASAGCYNKSVGIVTISDKGSISAKLYKGDLIPDETTDAILKELHDETDEVLSKKIAETKIFLDGQREVIRTKETNLGDLIADSIRISSSADISVIGGGSIRTSIDVGDITLMDVYNVNPFYDDIWLIDVTGKDVKDAMEFSYQHLGTSFGGYLQVSGMTVTYNPSKDPGSRVESIKVNGAEVSDDDRFKMATLDYLAMGGDGYNMFVGNSYEVIGDSLKIMMDYIEGIGTITESTVQMDRQIAV